MVGGESVETKSNPRKMRIIQESFIIIAVAVPNSLLIPRGDGGRETVRVTNAEQADSADKQRSITYIQDTKRKGSLYLISCEYYRRSSSVYFAIECVSPKVYRTKRRKRETERSTSKLIAC